jgi:phosphate transport system substrate-binding protein
MKRIVFLSLLTAAATGLTSCGGKGKKTVKVSGSNTMVQVGQSWAQTFVDKTGIKVSVSGGGSGIGIKGLIDGQIDICTSSRTMKDEEKADVKAKHGKDAVEHIVGIDALAVFVNKDNPATQISVEQLKEVYLDGGSISTWEQLGPGGITGPIEVLGRESTSGTYEFIHDMVLKKAKFRSTVAAQSSSQAIIDNLANIKGSIAYDGMAFNDASKVKWLSVSAKTGEPGVLPNADDARSGKYPLARKLYLYTIGEPEGEVKQFIDFAKSAEGQALLAKTGYVALQ